ncbi:MAG: site-2 protease family protein [Oscillospiraceae bacterium]|nr:site-2 protease family protein [Oscillospiraceae bacterium]
MSIVFAILLFSVLIFVHELGHFLAAKASGVQVNEFSMFMGPAIWKKKKGDTLYAIRCIPIGGYCAMEGEDQETDNPRSFQKAAWWKRFGILVAGSAMNLVIGILLFAIFFGSVYTAFPDTQVESFTDCSTLQGENALLPGDRILKIDGERLFTTDDFTTLLYIHADRETHDLLVERNGQKVELFNVPMLPHQHTEGDSTYSHYGITFKTVDANVFSCIGYTLKQTVGTVNTVRLSLQMLITGKVGLSDMSGPVGIVQQMSIVADAAGNWTDALLNLLYFGGYIAINLAVMNMLPIPALDGGRVVALLLTTAIEAVTKKKLNPKYEGYIHAAGMVLLLALMAVIFFKDIFVIFKG